MKEGFHGYYSDSDPKFKQIKSLAVHFSLLLSIFTELMLKVGTGIQ